MSGDFETLSGYILKKLGKIPKENEEIDLENVKISVVKVARNRIVEVKVTKK